MASTVLLRALGLATSPNELAQQPGTLSDATNVIIRRDNVIEPRRGYKLYGPAFGSASDTAKQLLTYQHRILRHYNNTLSFDSDGNGGAWSDFAGTYTEPSSGRRMRSIESNGNFYFTTSTGVKKISATSASQFSTANNYVVQAGGVKAIDIQTRLKVTSGVQTSFFLQDSTVGYRAVWGYNDANTNLVLGTPSQYNQIYNPLLSLVIYDFNRTLGTLDDMASGVTVDTNASGTMIDDENYVTTYGLKPTDTAISLKNNLVNLATKIDQDILYANDTGTNVQLRISSAAISSGTCTITFSSGNPSTLFNVGSNIFLASFAVSGGNALTINGAQVVSAVNATTVSFTTTSTATSIVVTGSSIVSNEYRSLKDSTGALFNTVATPNTPATNGQLTYLQSYLGAIIARLQSEKTTVISTSQQTNFVTKLSLTTTATVLLDIGIPNTVTSAHFLQIYRSSVVQASSTQILSTDVFSSDELALVYEAFPTAAQLAAGVVTVEDITLDFFRGANLYTNPDSGEGIDQANDIPPAALDINVFKNTVFYANTRTRHRLYLNLLGVTNMISDYNGGATPNLVLSNSVLSNTYNFVTGVQQVVDFTCVADVANSLNGKYFLISSANNYRQYYVWYKTSGGVASDPAVSGFTGIEVFINTGDSAATVATKTANTLARYIFDFSTSISTADVIITNVDQGYTNAPSAGTSGFTVNTTTSGRGERYTKETTAFTLPAGSAFNNSGTSNYFTLNVPFDHTQYYVWFQCGTSSDPALSGKVGIQVSILAGDANTAVATKAKTAIAAVTSAFTATVNSNVVTVTNVNYGPASDSTASMPGGYSFTVTQQGALEVLLSSNVSVATAVDSTARSLVRVVNRNAQDCSYAYYLSTVQGVPGEMLFEARTLDTNTVYALGNNTNTGSSFSPNISPTVTGITATNANPTVVTANAHGMNNGDLVVITGTDSKPCIDGVYTISNVTTNTFTIALNVLTSATKGSLIPAVSSQFSTNEVRSNRIYYAKNLQPEAVPIVNFFDVGAVNRAILRIFPLRDSLFVFKEDGLWRVSGETTPYTIALFDSSYILKAADSLDVSNNIIYGWTTQGIHKCTEAGTSPISRIIDVDILKLAASNFNPNFGTITWGIGYESDNSYTVYVAKNASDKVATIGYRYSNLTNSWTTVASTATCGIINPADDRMYRGAGDTNYVEQERKSFDRTDYADRELSLSLTSGNLLSSNQILFSSVTGISVGDVLTQTQNLSTYEYNALLEKLDTDPNLTLKNYFNTLQSVAGDDMSLKLYNPTNVSGLAVKLDSEPGITTHGYVSICSAKSGTITSNSVANPTVITTSAPHGLVTGRTVFISGVAGSSPSINGTYSATVLSPTTFTVPVNVITSGTGGSFVTVDSDFADIRARFSAVTLALNADATTGFKNYASLSTTTLMETIVTGVNTATRVLTINLALPWVCGPMTVYKAIPTTFTYAPNRMMAGQEEFVMPQYVGDPLSLKHLREATIIFEKQDFTTATMSFATDLVPAFIDVTIIGSGNGIFGNSPFGAGFFGGDSNSAPFRTYIPRNCQRCRYITVKFSHQTARESYSILGTTITGEIGQSTRAYR